MRHPSRAVSELMERFSVTRQLAGHIDEYLGNVAAAVRDDQRKANAADLAALRAENARLREALRFYANMHNYIYKEDEPGIRSMRVLRDSGNIARAALAAAPNRD